MCGGSTEVPKDGQCQWTPRGMKTPSFITNTKLNKFSPALKGMSSIHTLPADVLIKPSLYAVLVDHYSLLDINLFSPCPDVQEGACTSTFATVIHVSVYVEYQDHCVIVVLVMGTFQMFW